jgi:cell division protein ZapE
VRELTDEHVALRLVVLTDPMCDRDLPLLAGGVPLDRMLSPEMLKGGCRRNTCALSRLIAVANAGSRPSRQFTHRLFGRCQSCGIVVLFPDMR